MMTRLAIIGTGIAGLGCAHFLHARFNITLYEQDSHIGGHTNTVDVPEGGQEISIDTGFMVYNEKTYPNLIRLFNELQVPVKNTDMSFSVQHQSDNIEWCGSGLNHLFAQRRNLISPRYWKMLLNLNRFNKEAALAMASGEYDHWTVADYVREKQLGKDFLQWFLIPMSAAIWSSTPEQMLAFPIRTLLRFFHNHGFLGLQGHFQWKTVSGGAKSYVAMMTRPFAEKIHKNVKAVAVKRSNSGVTVTLSDGRQEEYDKVILACHADQALALLADADIQESSVLEKFQYQPNQATLHTDTSVMPKRKLCWASWNYQVNHDPSSKAIQPATHYWMNNLQGLSAKQNYFVSINGEHAIDPAKVLKRIAYEHPIFSVPAIAAQAEALPNLNRRSHQQQVYFCGSYFKYGFHEDAFTSALDLCRIITQEALWQPSQN